MIHHATLTPTKLGLLTEWLPEQSWYQGTECVRVRGDRVNRSPGVPSRPGGRG